MILCNGVQGSGQVSIAFGVNFKNRKFSTKTSYVAYFRVAPCPRVPNNGYPAAQLRKQARNRGLTATKALLNFR